MKKINFKKYISIIGMFLLGFFLMACGNSSGDGSEVTLELFSNKSENVNTYKELISKFEEENPNIKIKLETPPEAETVLRTRLTRNDLPDIMSIGGNNTYGELAEEEVFYDFTNEEIMKKIQPAYKEMLAALVNSDNENDYGVPYATNANGIIYNKEKFDEMNMDIPNTWDEFIDLLKQAQDEGIEPILFTLGDSWTAMPTWNSLGGVLVEDNFHNRKSERATTFAEEYNEVADKYLTLLDYAEGDIFGIDYDDGNAKFANGEALFYSQGNWAIPDIKENNSEIELGYFAFPAADKAEDNDLVSGVDVLFTVSETTNYKEEALQFIEFMMEESIAQQYIEEQAAFSALNDIIQEDPIFENVQSKFENGELTSFPDHYYPAGLSADNLVQDFLINKDKEKFFSTIDNEWDKVIDR